MTIALALGAEVFLAVSAASGDDGRERLATALVAHFQPAQIDLQSGARNRGVVRGGRLLVLLADSVPARLFRVMLADAKSPVFHVMNFARVDIGLGGGVRADVEPLRVSRGARLVVLDVNVTATEVRLQTHTAEPIRAVPSTEPVYGCTEFVFNVGSEVLGAGNVEAVLRRIEGILEWTPGARVCAPGNTQLCLEP